MSTAASFKLTSPTKRQHLINSRGPTSLSCRWKLRNQITVHCAVSSSATVRKKCLLPTDGSALIWYYNQMLKSKQISLYLTQTADIEIHLRAMTDDNQNRLQWAKIFKWVDLLSSFYLPQPYLQAELPAHWQIVLLKWPPAWPNQQLMLQYASLHTFVAFSILSSLWNSTAQPSQEHVYALSTVCIKNVNSSPDRQKFTQTFSTTPFR